MKLQVNGEDVDFKGDGEMPLLWWLRENAGYKGVKFGCGIGQCGACTVHVDGNAVRSCTLPMSALSGQSVTTIEGLAQGEKLHPVQQAWIEEDVAQCGYCQAGQIMAVSAFLERHPNPSDEDIDRELSDLCRCGTYTRMRKAIHRAGELSRGGAA